MSRREGARSLVEDADIGDMFELCEDIWPVEKGYQGSSKSRSRLRREHMRVVVTWLSNNCLWRFTVKGALEDGGYGRTNQRPVAPNCLILLPACT
jgi:hypothetical protein